MDFVDLDKVLDDFESIEGADDCPPGTVINNTIPPDFLENKQISDISQYALPANQQQPQYNQGYSGLPTTTNSVEYEPPDALDMSEADFGPSASTGDGGYFIPEDSATEYANGFSTTHHQEASVHRSNINVESSEYHRDRNMDYASVGLVAQASMDSDCNDSDQETNGTVSFFSSSPPGDSSAPPILPIDLTQGIITTDAPLVVENHESSINMSINGPSAFSTLNNRSPSPSNVMSSNSQQSPLHGPAQVYDHPQPSVEWPTEPQNSMEVDDIKPNPPSIETRSPIQQDALPDIICSEGEAEQTSPADSTPTISGAIPETEYLATENGNESSLEHTDVENSSEPNNEDLKQEVATEVYSGENFPDKESQLDKPIDENCVVSNVENDQEPVGTLKSDIPSSDMQAVGFSDMPHDDMSELDLDSYLEKLHDPSVEFSNAIPDELQEALSSVSITNSQSTIPSVKPDNLHLTSSITNQSEDAQCGVPTDGESAATVTSDDVSDSCAELRLRPPSDSGDSRRGSDESIERFLNPTIASPTITTPMEDTGFSKIPGLSPGLSTMDESDEPEEKPDETMSSTTPTPSSSAPEDSIVSPPEPVDNSLAGGTTGFSRPATLGGDAIIECVKPEQKPPASPGLGARPKELGIMTAVKKGRPSSLLGLSTPDLNSPSPIVVYPAQPRNDPVSEKGSANQIATPIQNSHDAINMQLAAQINKTPLSKKQLNLEIKQQIVANEQVEDNTSEHTVHDNTGFTTPPVGTSINKPRPMSLGLSQPASQGLGPGTAQPSMDPQPVDIAFSIDEGQQGGLIPPAKQMRRPTSLRLSFNQQDDFPTRQTPQSPSVDLSGGASPAEDLQPCVAEDSSGAQTPQSEEPDAIIPQAEAAGASSPVFASPEPRVLSPPTSSNINIAITQLGKIAPVWLPDAEAPTCMQCEAKFTFTKRRHHCRACGKVFCSGCCNLRSKLQYLEQKEARVCSKCYQDLIRAQYYERNHGPVQSPNPNNPSEYCSTIPPSQQVQGTANAPPTVMVPVNAVPGVLRKEGSRRSIEPKQVMFSDGIRPGGDLTELDGQAEARLPPQRTGRKTKRVEKPGDKSNSPKVKTVKASETSRNVCLIPDEGLPPVILSTGVKGDYSIEENPHAEKIMPQIKDSDDPSPVVFALNKNLFVLLKIINLDCCVNRVCWCFTTKGMCTVGQDEIVVVLECLPDEKTIPRDLFCHFHTVYEEAGKGNTVSHLGHTIFAQGILGSRDHGGFMYIKPTFQCTNKLLMPPAPYIFGILLQKWETPWAKVFPIRLMLRLGAEFRYYPCPLISVRFRKPVYGEIGHTIMNLLADFRNYQYMLPQVRGVVVHMEDKKTYINFPRNRYDDVIKVINNSNDHVMGLGANFSMQADSHLVCMQNEDGNYQTQAINIQNKPRKVTGASFIVFNGALKTSSGLRAKSSIVEDGLMIQITADAMSALKQALRDMKDYTIGCGSQELPEPEEWVVVQWADDDKNVNVGVKSPLDNKPMDGVESLQISSATDYVGENRTIRWTEVFFMRTEGQNTRIEPVDLSRLAESLATACCMALTPHLDKLKEASLTKLALRVTIDREQVGYEIGANGEKLPGDYMNDLDNELILVIHNAASNSQEGPVVLELILHIIE